MKANLIFKQSIALILVLVTVFSVCGCKNGGQKSPGQVNGGAFASSTPIVTPFEEPHIPFTEKYAHLADEYTVQMPGYGVLDREAPQPIDEIENPRYIKMGNFYASANYEETNEAVIMLTGDLMCQGRQQQAAMDKYGEYKFNESFRVVKDVFYGADLVVGNLETQLSESAPYMGEEKAVDGKPHCNAPSTYLGALRYAGFDALVTANNHCCDTGIMGLLETHEHLYEYGFMNTGTFNPDMEERFLLINVNGIKLALMSYATYFNTKDTYLTDAGENAMLNRYSKQKVQADVEAARAKGAEFIIAYNHWGTEYTNEDNEKQRTIAQEMADAGIDYIIGSHPHALQRYDKITAADGRKVPCIYSMGNFVSHMTKTVAKDTIILRMKLERDENGDVVISDEGYIPCRVFETYAGYNYLILPLSRDYNGDRGSKYFASAYERITKVIGDKLPLLGTYDFINE